MFSSFLVMPFSYNQYLTTKHETSTTSLLTYGQSLWVYAYCNHHHHLHHCHCVYAVVCIAFLLTSTCLLCHVVPSARNTESQPDNTDTSSSAMCRPTCHPSHGVCVEGTCRCNEGWTGDACDIRLCHQLCEEHGTCNEGVCVCDVGWNGDLCTLGNFSKM